MAILCFLVLGPIFQDFVRVRILMDIFITVILISGIYAVSKKKYVPVAASLLSLPLLMSMWLTHFVEIYSLTLIGDCFGILFMAFIVIIILSHIFKEHRVTYNVIYGAIVAYLLMAITWVFIFSILEGLHPGSFVIAEVHPEVDRPLFVYYSFVTITTLGYGDITPVTETAKSFSLLEAVTGQLYLAILVARLVGIQISQSMDENN